MSELTVTTLETIKSKSKDDYLVGILTALPIERAAVMAMLDEEHHPPFDFQRHSLDSNSYTWGKIKEHNIVLVSLSAGIYGTTSATTTVLHVKYAFPEIKWGLMVGIAAGIPSDERDIRLGDVVVSQPQGGSSGVFQYDFGKVREQDDWQGVGWLARPPEILLKALSTLQSDHELLDGPYQAQRNLQEAIRRHPGWGMRYGFPHGQIDRLFLSSYAHKKPFKECAACDMSMVVKRPERLSTDFQIHYGVVASGNSLVKDAHFRDRIARRMNQCICVEMEAAGMMNDFPCLVIRGICDYADSHKNDNWQRYASATAAAFAKELLSYLSKADPRNERDHVRTKVHTVDDHFDNFKSADTASTKSNVAATAWDTPVVKLENQAVFYELEDQATPYELANQDTAYELDSLNISRQVDNATSSTWAKVPGAYDDISDAESETQATTGHFDEAKFANQEEDAISTTTSVVAVTNDTHKAEPLQDQQDKFSWISSIIDLTENHEKGEEPHELSPAKTVVETDVHHKLDMGLVEDQQCRSSRSPIIDLLESHEKEEKTHQLGPSTTTNKAAVCDMGMRSVPDQKGEPPNISSVTNNIGDRGKKDETHDVEPIPVLTIQTLGSVLSVHEAPVAETEDDSGLIPSHSDLIQSEEIKVPPSNKVCLMASEEQQKVESTTTKRSEKALNQSAHPLVTTTQGTSDTVRLEAWLDESLTLLLKIAPERETSKTSQNHEAPKSGSAPVVPTKKAPDSVSKTPLPVEAKKTEGRKAADKKGEVKKVEGKKAEGEKAKGEKPANNSFNVDKKIDANHTTLLHLAASDGDCDKVKTLLDLGANIHAKNIRGTMPLHFAAIHGQVEVVGLLLDRKANIEAGGGSENCTALHLAASAGQVKVVILLLNRKANLETTSARKRTALHFAVQYGHEQMTRLLLGYGAKLEARGSDNFTALHYAAAENHVKVIGLLLRRQANLKAVTTDKWTALQHAASKGHEETVEFLLDHGAEIEARDNEGKTALHIAACKNHMDIIRLLLGRKARLNAADDNGRTALHHAVWEGHTDIVRLLVYRGASLESMAAGGRTALHYAVCRDSVDLTKLLLDHKANLEAAATGRWTSLHFAAAKGSEEMVELLLAYGADPRVKTEHRSRPSDLAKKQGHDDIVQLLKDSGAGPRPALFRF